MSMIIEVLSREWDTINLTKALEVPAERNYVAHLTVDDHDAQVTFDGEVQLLSLDGEVLTVAPWVEAIQMADETKSFAVLVADIRRVEMF